MALVNLERGLWLRRKDYAAMAHHVAAEAPLEACGLVAGQGLYSAGVYPVPNALRSPIRFRMEPQAQWQAMKAILDQGLTLLAFYHSHPQGPPRPSAIDAHEMAYPEVFSLIWVPRGQTWLCRAFRWSGHGFVEVPLRLA